MTTAHDESKVNLLILASSLWIGGAETIMRHLALTVDRTRFNVTVCHLKERGQVGDELAAAGVDIIGVPPRADGGVDYFTFLKLLKIVRERRIHIVHSHTPHGLVDANLCRLGARRLKLIHTFHFGNYPHMQPRLMKMERVFAPYAHQLVAVGNAQKDQLVRTHGLKPASIRTIFNGVVPPVSAADPTLRTRAGADGKILIGTLATLIEQKGLKDLLTVARRLKEAGDLARFIIVGEGHLRPELERLRREMDLDDTVTLAGWVPSAADVALPVFDIFFQPSLWEAMSVAVLEAMAAGKPIVATRVGENPSMIDDERDGLLVDVGDCHGMAAALLRLVHDETLRRRLGQSALDKVRQRFTVAQMTREYEALYLQVVGQA